MYLCRNHNHINKCDWYKPISSFLSTFFLSSPPLKNPFLLKQPHHHLPSTSLSCWSSTIPLSQHLLPLKIPFLLKQNHHHQMMTEPLSLNFINQKSHDSHNRQLNSLNPELFWVSQNQICLVIFFIHFCQIELHFPHAMVKFCNQILQHETHSLGSRICVETDPKKVKAQAFVFSMWLYPPCRSYIYIYIYL